MSNKFKCPKVGEIIKNQDNFMGDGNYLGVPIFFVDENNHRVFKKAPSEVVVKNIRHGRRKNKGWHTLTVTPINK